MDLDPETWDNKTITSGLKNYLRSARPTLPGVCLGLPAASFKIKPPSPRTSAHSARPVTHTEAAGSIQKSRVSRETDAACALRPPPGVSPSLS